MSRVANLLRRAAIIAGITIGLGLAGEIAVRVVAPSVNLQGTDRGLFVERAYGASVGLRPNARGDCFGIEARIDATGCRALPPADAKRQWLILGDSVAFGVGVPTEETFVGRLQAMLPDVRLLHTATLGHSVWNYRDVLSHALADRRAALERVVLFWCLNDVEGYLVELPTPGSGLTGWLRTRSKLYVACKSWLTDRSDAYYRHDRALYESPTPTTREALEVAQSIARRARGAGLAVDVFLLPYEGQLRPDAVDPFLPQRAIAGRFRAGGATVHDLGAALRRAHAGEPAALYLTADAMHFSAEGHRRITREVARALGLRTASR